MTTYFPSQVVLEVTSRCNLECKGCAVHGPDSFTTRQTGNMSEQDWRTAIKEIGSWDKELNLTAHGGGEPLLHPNFKEILQLVKSFPKLNAGFLTNGMLLNKEWAEFVVDIGLDWIGFSIDGVSPQTHKIVRKGSNLEIIEKHLLELLLIRERSSIKKPSNKEPSKSPKPLITLNMVAYDEVYDQKEQFVQKWLNKVDNITISHYRNPPSSRRALLVPQERKPCFLLWSQMIIASDGRVGLCCEDFNIDFPLGRVGEKPLIEIWNGSEISKLRKMHEAGDFTSHPMCHDCDTWSDNIIQKTEENKNLGFKMLHRASQTEYKPLNEPLLIHN
ncbi:MAG: radical SAM protein [Desulfamplus sp.]|nr:radical SAM protein [Desulfamplus sp.]